MASKRNQTFHETLIPLLVEGIGAKTYLEFGTHQNETIGKVRCERRIGVDIKPFQIPGIWFFEMTTQAFIKNCADSAGPFDFVFIDADHSAEAARLDLLGIWPHVSNEGIVCLHDTNPETKSDTDPGLCGDSWKFAKEISLESDYHYNPEYECVTLPYHPGLTIVRKRVKWGPQ